MHIPRTSRWYSTYGLTRFLRPSSIRRGVVLLFSYPLCAYENSHGGRSAVTARSSRKVGLSGTRGHEHLILSSALASRSSSLDWYVHDYQDSFQCIGAGALVARESDQSFLKIVARTNYWPGRSMPGRHYGALTTAAPAPPGTIFRLCFHTSPSDSISFVFVHFRNAQS